MKYMAYFVLASVAAAGAARAQMAPPIPMTAAQFASSAAGQSVTLVVRVDRLARESLDAELLERISDALYRPTGKRVSLYLPAETSFVMGSMSDLKPGAVVFVYAVATTAAHADVKKVVVVTPYVKVE
ncbi:MAG TPA: hypothetical protein VIW73_02255 [Candidatus Cybelea sp.]